MQEGAAGDAVPGTTAVAEIAVAVGESGSRSRSRSRLRARSRSLLGSVAALWFSGEAIACLLAGEIMFFYPLAKFQAVLSENVFKLVCVATI